MVIYINNIKYSIQVYRFGSITSLKYFWDFVRPSIKY